jgi:hypothetical protein
MLTMLTLCFAVRLHHFRDIAEMAINTKTVLRRFTYLSFCYETPPHLFAFSFSLSAFGLFAQRPLRPYRQGV